MECVHRDAAMPIRRFSAAVTIARDPSALATRNLAPSMRTYSNRFALCENSVGIVTTGAFTTQALQLFTWRPV